MFIVTFQQCPMPLLTAARVHGIFSENMILNSLRNSYTLFCIIKSHSLTFNQLHITKNFDFLTFFQLINYAQKLSLPVNPFIFQMPVTRHIYLISNNTPCQDDLHTLKINLPSCSVALIHFEGDTATSFFKK